MMYTYLSDKHQHKVFMTLSLLALNEWNMWQNIAKKKQE